MTDTFKQKIDGGFTRITLLLKQVRDDLAGKQGTLASLNTVQKSSLVAALNEVKATVDSLTQISDGTTSASSTWSSTKISAQINAAITSLISGAGVDSDTLKELADRISALAQADTGLVSTAAAQAFSTAQKSQARSNIDAASASEVGDIAAADFVTLINTTYAGA